MGGVKLLGKSQWMKITKKVSFFSISSFEAVIIWRENSNISESDK